MVWAKRRFAWAEYAPYQDRLEKLQLANASRHREFMMFMMFMIEETVGMAEVYVGLPTQQLMSVFDGFEPVGEAALPKVVDTLLLADISEFSKRFEFRHDKTER